MLICHILFHKVQKLMFQFKPHAFSHMVMFIHSSVVLDQYQISIRRLQVLVLVWVLLLVFCVPLDSSGPTGHFSLPKENNLWEKILITVSHTRSHLFDSIEIVFIRLLHFVLLCNYCSHKEKSSLHTRPSETVIDEAKSVAFFEKCNTKKREKVTFQKVTSYKESMNGEEVVLLLVQYCYWSACDFK